MKNIWLSQAEIASLPTSGAAWDNVVKYANVANGAADLVDQESNNNVCCLAAALVYARTGDQTALGKVKKALAAITAFDVAKLGRALALGRELCAYVIAADLIDYNDSAFNDKIRALLTAKTTSGPANLIKCQLERPNNWGMHATASLAAVYAYLGDDVGLKSVANVFKGWLGDYNAYHAFKYTSPMDWHADATKPVGINPKGATKNGHSIDGVLPDDMRRGGGFPGTWPPDKAKMKDSYQYEWEALQGAVVAAQILSRVGGPIYPYPAWEWSDKALLRAVQWLYSIDWPAVGDDGWQPWLINAAYGTNFPTSQSGVTGKNMGFTSWTHATPVIVKPPVPDPTPDPPPDPTPTPTTPDVAAAIAAVQRAQGALTIALAALGA